MSDIVERLREAAANLSEIYPDYAEAADEISRLRAENNRFRENELLLSKDGKKWRSAIDIIKEISAENERLREALKPFANATVIDLTHNGENFVKAIVVSEDEILCARTILEGTTKCQQN